MHKELFNDYKSHTEVETALISKYGKKLPVQILELWKKIWFWLIL